jgi:hypothetical protein
MITPEPSPLFWKSSGIVPKNSLKNLNIGSMLSGSIVWVTQMLTTDGLRAVPRGARLGTPTRGFDEPGPGSIQIWPPVPASPAPAGGASSASATMTGAIGWWDLGMSVSLAPFVSGSGLPLVLILTHSRGLARSPAARAAAQPTLR